MPSGIDPNSLYQQQLAQELLKQSQQGPQPLRRGMPTLSESIQSVRNANSGPMTGRGALGALRGVAGPLGVGAALMPVASGIGNALGDAYGRTLVEDEAAQPPIQPGRRNTYLPQELESMQGGEVLQQPRANPNMVGYIPDELQEEYGMPVEELSPEEIIGDPNTIAQDTRLEDLLAQPDRPAPQVQEMPNSRLALETLSTNKVGQAPVRRETPKRGFFGHLGEFFRSGGRNRERDDYNAELDTYLKANSFTDPEKLAAGTAREDVLGARDKNFQAELAKYSGEGMSQQDKFRADMLGAERKAGLMEGVNEKKAKAEHGYKLEEIKAGAASQKLTPEARKDAFITDMLEKYPDIAMELLNQRGINPDKGFIDSIRKGREKSSEGEAMKILLLERLMGDRLKPSATTSKGAREEAKKKVEIKDTSMLKKKDE